MISRNSKQTIADNCAPIRNHDGIVTGAVLVFCDVTQEYAAKALQQAKDDAELLTKIVNIYSYAASSKGLSLWQT